MTTTPPASQEIDGKGRTVREPLAGRREASRRFKPYPAYKDSGVEWLGKIPAGWEVERLRFVSESNPLPSEVRGLPGETEVSLDVSEEANRLKHDLEGLLSGRR